MRFGVITAVLMIAVFTTLVECTPLKVASFNIRVFGVAKTKNPTVMDLITRIVSRYDIILIQEIRDTTNKAIYQLLEKLNNSGKGFWNIVLSSRLGRSNTKEQYAFLYKPDLVRVLNQHQWSDETDAFEREPFIVHFAPAMTNYDIGGFAFMGIHTKPDRAPQEINKLTEVYNWVSAKWGFQDMLIGGDFNADCSYVSKKDWKNITLRNDPRFVWTIDDGVDTTMTDSNCAYDRLVIAGKNLLEDYIKGSAKPFKFDEVYGIAKDLALSVSDHYPVELALS